MPWLTVLLPLVDFTVRAVGLAWGGWEGGLTGTTVAHLGQRTAFPSAVSGACMRCVQDGQAMGMLMALIIVVRQGEAIVTGSPLRLGVSWL